MKNLLCINIGNSRTTVAMVRRAKAGPVVRQPTAGATPEGRATLLHTVLSGGAPDGVVIGSTVPAAVAGWRRAVSRLGWGDPLIVTPDLDPGFPMDAYPGRVTLGADRLADICGGVARYGRPLIVIDLGTALTLNVVTADRGFVGGLILPGPDLAFRSLATGTAQLPNLSGQPASSRNRGLGRTTEESIRLGVTRGWTVMLEGLIRSARDEMRAANAPVVITGGGARRIRPRAEPPMHFDADLTLFGLACLYRLNR